MNVQNYGPHMKRGKKCIGNLKQMTRERKKYEKSCEVRHVAQDGLAVGREAFLD